MKNKVSHKTNYLIKQLPKATAYVNLCSKIIHVSDSWIKNFKEFKQSSINSNIHSLFPKLKEKWEKDLEYAFLGYHNPSQTSILYTPTLDKIYLEWVISPWFDEDENIIGAIIQIEDNTKNIELKKEIERLKLQLDLKSNLSNIGSWEYSSITDCVKWCDITRKIHNAPADFSPSILDTLHFFQEGEHREYMFQCINNALYKKMPWNEKLLIVTVDDSEIWVHTTGKPIIEDNRVIGFSGTLEHINNNIKANQNESFLESETLRSYSQKEKSHIKPCADNFTLLRGSSLKNKKRVKISDLDFAQLKQKEEELRRLVNVTSLQNKKLVNFGHIVSHNLRSHTANFSMLLGFLIKENESLEREKLINMLITASDNLLETIDNLNEVVEINAKPYNHKEQIHINSIISKNTKSLKSLLRHNKSKITNKIPETLYIKGIPTFTENILLNVLSNAIKFEDKLKDCQIILSAKKTDKHTIITIKDNGLGIDLDKYKNKIFGMYKTFHQRDDTRGVGLYIAKNQIDAMKGKFVVKSKVGIGTTFKIYFNEFE